MLKDNIINFAFLVNMKHSILLSKYIQYTMYFIIILINLNYVDEIIKIWIKLYKLT